MTNGSRDTPWTLELGALPRPDGSTRFRVWAPRAKSVSVRLVDRGNALAPLAPAGDGYFEAILRDAPPGTRYRFALDERVERPDPASRFQPDGVHGPSEVVDPTAFRWSDGSWRGLSLDRLIVYELHVGTFTATGTCEAVIPHLDYLRRELGVTAIELMPVAQFPGARNWGYDGTYPFGVQSSYGGPEGLKRLIDACHANDLAVIMDVVYNHLGPEGNYLGEYGPYFTDRYRTPWGQALNFDGPDSDPVRHYIVSNALYWITEYHVDGLRLDAIHGIFDFSARHILEELGDAVHAEAARLGRAVTVIAESDLNDTRVIAPPAEGGHGLDGQWSDDFHHSMHTVLTGESAGYYADFGTVEHLATALRDGFVYAGQRSEFRRRRHGNSSRGRPPRQFVVSVQNHDQVGNRALGDRLTASVPPEALKVAAAALLLGPNVPLLFMGEEYAEPAPFQYFVDHGDPGLVEAVRRGRAEEFASFAWAGAVPDPQSPDTFARSRLTRERGLSPAQRAMFAWYAALIDLRQTVPALGAARTADHDVWSWESERVVVMHRRGPDGSAALLVFGFSDKPVTVRLARPAGRWTLRLDADEARFGGAGGSSDPPTLLVAGEGAPIALPGPSAKVFLAGPATQPASRG